MRVIGIDPGNSGALCLYVPIDEKIYVKDMPVVDGRVSPHGVIDILQHWERRPITVAAVELVHSMPRQGVASSFKFGMGYGVILGALAALDIPIVNVAPTAWTKYFGVGSDKEKHRRYAIETWPAQAHLFARKKDEGRADAALIARWATRGLPR
jgi:hypothetical protein